MGLAHSLVLAKHLGVDKLKAIRQFYDHYQVPKGDIRGNAFELLGKQTNCSIPDGPDVWNMFRSIGCEFPLFPYRMQAVALWDEATNWRVLQASAHHDIDFPLQFGYFDQDDNEEGLLHNFAREVNIFDFCTEWSKRQVPWKGSVGLVIETVRISLRNGLLRVKESRTGNRRSRKTVSSLVQ